MKVHQTTSVYTHFFPNKVEKFKVVQFKDKNEHVLKTEVWRVDIYEKSGKMNTMSYKGAHVNELL